MLKKTTFLFVLSFCVAQLQAQNNPYDESDALIVEQAPLNDTIFRNDDNISSPVFDNTDKAEEDAITTKDYNSTFAEDVLGDTTVNFRNIFISPDSLNSWKENKKYAWINNLDSLLKDKQQKEEAEMEDTMRKGKKLTDGISAFDRILSSGILKMILWIIAGCVILFIIQNLFLSKGIFSSGGKKAKNVVEEQAEIDNNMESDFESLQRKAYAEGNLRMTMRYLFLKTLQKLNDRELIRFAADKTNTAYARELPAAKRNEFSSLALYYEYIWYGHIEVQKQTFDGIENKFNEFLKRI
jgi:Domain of unknown function (DUF4129)